MMKDIDLAQLQAVHGGVGNSVTATVEVDPLTGEIKVKGCTPDFFDLIFKPKFEN